MHNNTQFSPVLPAILTCMLDPEKGSVLVETNNFYTGLREAFEERGFKVVGSSNASSDAYNTIVATLPFGQKEYPELNMLDRYVNSPAEKIILVVFNNLLFSNRPRFWAAKRDLLIANCIEASIMLPQRLMPDSPASVSLLIIDKSRSKDSSDWHVNFIDASDMSAKAIESLHKDGDFDAIRALVGSRFSYTQQDCVKVDARDIAVQGASLLASAHCISDDQKVARKIVEESDHTPLSEVANFFRPLIPSKAMKGEKVHILNVNELSPYGYTYPVAGQDGYFERAGKTDPLLRAGDIVIGIRGVLGKVGIISPDFSTDEPWVASQSCLVLRPAKKDYDPLLLFMYLRSAVGQAMIQMLNCGATVPMLQIADLKNLPVILPAPEQAEKMLTDFGKEVNLCTQIASLDAERNRLANAVWVLPQ